jgi:hypothetical protein
MGFSTEPLQDYKSMFLNARVPAQMRLSSGRGYAADQLSMQKPEIDDKLTLLTAFGKTEAICTEVMDDPVTEGGTLLKVMARGPFEQGQQCWIVDRDGSKIGAMVEKVAEETIDKELTLSTVLPT